VSPREAFVDHLTLRVRDLGASRRFYAAALEPWGSRESKDDWGISFADGNNVEGVFHGRQEVE
jgi:catechol 2,3-dioxygenase-like lactoylglutathione lyase family enzyme